MGTIVSQLLPMKSVRLSMTIPNNRNGVRGKGRLIGLVCQAVLLIGREVGRNTWFGTQITSALIFPAVMRMFNHCTTVTHAHKDTPAEFPLTEETMITVGPTTVGGAVTVFTKHIHLDMAGVMGITIINRTIQDTVRDRLQVGGGTPRL